MRKIPTVFERDWDGDRSRVTPQVNPVRGCSPAMKELAAHDAGEAP